MKRNSSVFRWSIIVALGGFLLLLILMSTSCRQKIQEGDRISIMGHRGGLNWAPENTLAAFRLCAENGVDWETDLNLTADGEIVLLHDMTLDRTTDAETVFGSQDIQLYSKTLAQIKTLDAGSYFNSDYAGEKIPTLDELLDCFVACAKEGTVISMDTKLDRLSPGSDVYQRIIDKIAERNLFDRVFIEVYSAEGVHKTKNLNNGDKLKYAIWVSSDTVRLNKALASGCFSRIHASSEIAFKADDVHAADVPFFACHPVDNQSDWDMVKEYALDGVSTDRPDVAKYVVENDIPSCTIKYPVNNSSFNAGEIIIIIVSVGDSDSSISKVEFYRGGSIIGTDTSFPYTCSWPDLTRGSYSLTAKVYDNGMSKTSPVIKIEVAR